VILYSDAKINIGLHILKKRGDGFHDISTLMAPVPFRDIIEITIADGNERNFSMEQSGLPVPGRQEDNLCYRSWELFCRAAGKINVRIHLHKRIPPGAGLGGGSSNGTAVLKGLNMLSGNKLNRNDLLYLAAQLGSDCSLFVDNKPAFAEGRGEILSDASIDLDGIYVTLLHPGVEISTAWAYQNITPGNKRRKLKKLLSSPPDTWKTNIFNDFEPVVFGTYPEIASLKAELYLAGAFFASMSGSGSAVYGLFRKKPELGIELRKQLIWEGSI
jgi:4-diphosphocytidyl-2-C-methyl-D-erythritol kinase